jgi:hypothetical protein
LRKRGRVRITKGNIIALWCKTCLPSVMHANPVTPPRTQKPSRVVSRFSVPALPCVLPRTLRAQAEQLLDRQLWLWNCDIKHPSGNALLAYGFTATRSPAGTLDTTVYTLALAVGRRMLASECGLYITKVQGNRLSEGTFLRRLGFDPCRADIVAEPTAGMPLQAEHMRVPHAGPELVETRSAIADALLAVAAYEEWVIARFGLSYRRGCLGDCAGRSWRTVVSADETVSAWRTLGDWYAVAQPNSGH